MQTQNNTGCSSKCCGCIEMRIGIVLIALFGIGWACYEFTIYLEPSSYTINAIFIVVEICAMLLLIGSIATIYGVYKSNQRILFSYIIVCGIWAVVWVFVVISTLNIAVSWQIPTWIYFTYIVRKYYYTLRNDGIENKQPQPNQPLIPANDNGNGNNYGNNFGNNNNFNNNNNNQQPHIYYIVHNNNNDMNNNMWTCASCTLQQPRSNVKCQICNTPNPFQMPNQDLEYQSMEMPAIKPFQKPQQIEPQQNINNNDDKWQCPQCTFEQLKSNFECEICGYSADQNVPRNQPTAYI